VQITSKWLPQRNKLTAFNKTTHHPLVCVQVQKRRESVTKMYQYGVTGYRR